MEKNTSKKERTCNLQISNPSIYVAVLVLPDGTEETFSPSDVFGKYSSRSPYEYYVTNFVRAEFEYNSVLRELDNIKLRVYKVDSTGFESDKFGRKIPVEKRLLISTYRFNKSSNSIEQVFEY